MSSIRAVLFDIGGVVVGSPIVGISRFERKLKLPVNYLNALVTAHGREGAFQRLERGELAMADFLPLFGQQMSDVELGNQAYRVYLKRSGRDCPDLPTSLQIDGADLWGEMMAEVHNVDQIIVHAIERLRARGLVVAALTNNWAAAEDEAAPDARMLREMFDHYIESSVVGLRKPDPAIFQHTLDLLGVKGSETAFLDDIGLNLKSAATLGIRGVRVLPGKSEAAVRELEQLVGFPLRGDDGRDAKL